MELLGIGLDLVSILITFVILVGVLLGKKNAMNEYFPILLLMHALALLADMGVMVFTGDTENIMFLEASVILQGAITLVGVSGFNLYVDKLLARKMGKSVIWRMVPFVICAILILFWISSLLHKMVFIITDDATFEKGGLYLFVVIVAAIIPVVDAFRVIINHVKEKIEKDVAVSLYFFISIPLIVLVAAELLNVFSLFFAAVTVSYLIMYIAIHVHTEQITIERKMEHTEMTTELIISQLQPHFMFNSLTNIKYLLKKKPDLADEAIDRFTRYLRKNLEFIQAPEYISFADELEHTKNYLWLEQLRFADLKIEYSIDEDQFLVPALSLQPIVENAVKHGVTKKIGGGTIQILVRDTKECYKIIVKDDGVGFNSDKQETNEQAHAGITDIRKRLLAFNKSTLSISSTEGVGTTATYCIMKGDD